MNEPNCECGMSDADKIREMRTTLESVSAILRHGDKRRGGQLSGESLFAVLETVEATLNRVAGGANNRPERMNLAG